MSFYSLFGSRNTNLELLTSVSVHGWSYMAEWRNFDKNNLLLTQNNLILLENVLFFINYWFKTYLLIGYLNQRTQIWNS